MEAIMCFWVFFIIVSTSTSAMLHESMVNCQVIIPNLCDPSNRPPLNPVHACQCVKVQIFSPGYEDLMTAVYNPTAVCNDRLAQEKVMVRRFPTLVMCLMIFIGMVSCTTTPKFEFPQDTRVGIVNLLKSHVTHKNLSGFATENFTNMD